MNMKKKKPRTAKFVKDRFRKVFAINFASRKTANIEFVVRNTVGRNAGRNIAKLADKILTAN